MANIPRVRAAGLWVPGSVVLAEEFEAFDEIRPWLINAADGSTHAPTTQIVLGGQGLRVSGPSRLDSITLGALAATGTLTVIDNSTLVVSGGTTGGLLRVDGHATTPGLIKLNGTNAELRVESGSFIQVKAGGALDLKGAATLYNAASLTANSGATINLSTGSTVNSSGDFYFSSSTWPKLSPTRSWSRRSLLLSALTYSGTRPSGPQAWKVYDPGAGDLIETPNADTPPLFLIEFIDLPPNGTLTQIEIACIGNGPGTVGMTFPEFQIIRWRGKTEDTMSALISDTHVLGNWHTTPISTTVPVTSLGVINRDYRYALKVNGSYYSGSPAAPGFFFDCVATGTSDDMRV